MLKHNTFLGLIALALASPAAFAVDNTVVCSGWAKSDAEVCQTNQYAIMKSASEEDRCAKSHGADLSAYTCLGSALAPEPSGLTCWTADGFMQCGAWPIGTTLTYFWRVSGALKLEYKPDADDRAVVATCTSAAGGTISVNVISKYGVMSSRVSKTMTCPSFGQPPL
jgi:hypothetical protein